MSFKLASSVITKLAAQSISAETAAMTTDADQFRFDRLFVDDEEEEEEERDKDNDDDDEEARTFVLGKEE